MGMGLIPSLKRSQLAWAYEPTNSLKKSLLVNQCSLGQFSICKANEKQSDEAIPIIQHMHACKKRHRFIYLFYCTCFFKNKENVSVIGLHCTCWCPPAGECCPPCSRSTSRARPSCRGTACRRTWGEASAALWNLTLQCHCRRAAAEGEMNGEWDHFFFLFFFRRTQKFLRIYIRSFSQVNFAETINMTSQLYGVNCRL